MSDAFALDAAGLASIATALIDEARQRGASDAVVTVAESRGVAVAVRQGRIQSRDRQAGSGLSLTVYRGRRQGTARATDLSPARRTAVVDAALAIASQTADDPFGGPAEAAHLGHHDADLDLDHPWALDIDAAIAIARRLEAGIAESGAEVQSDGAWVSSHRQQWALATSNGFCRTAASTVHSLAALALARRGERRQREHTGEQRRAAGDLPAPETIGAQAGRRALAALATRPLGTRRARVLFDARSATSLVGHLIQATSSRALVVGASFLGDGLDRPLFPAAVDLVEDPWQRRAMASMLFDAEGVGPRPRSVVEAGVLRGRFLTTRAARQLGTTPTGHASGPGNLRLLNRSTAPGDDFDQMLERLDTGLLVTGLTGEGVRLVDGGYSRGAQGFWVEGGVIRHAVDRITLAGRLPEMYAGIEAIGSDLHTEGPITTGSVLIDRLQIAGT